MIENDPDNENENDSDNGEFGTLSASKDFSALVLAFADGTSAEFTVDQAEALARHITEAVKVCRMKQQIDADKNARADARSGGKTDCIYNLDRTVN